MFDPTIYENLKVVLEGNVYDLDLSGQIQVIGRTDRIELSTMSRYYALKFIIPNRPQVTAEIRLWADTIDLAGEILELNSQDAQQQGCHLQPVFVYDVYRDNAESECVKASAIAYEIWGNNVQLEQKISYRYKHSSGDLATQEAEQEITMSFHRKFGEEVVEDLPQMVDHMIIMLDRLNS